MKLLTVLGASSGYSSPVITAPLSISMVTMGWDIFVLLVSRRGAFGFLFHEQADAVLAEILQ